MSISHLTHNGLRTRVQQTLKTGDADMTCMTGKFDVPPLFSGNNAKAFVPE
jgi:hypothetical protein